MTNHAIRVPPIKEVMKPTYFENFLRKPDEDQPQPKHKDHPTPSHGEGDGNRNYKEKPHYLGAYNTPILSLILHQYVLIQTIEK